MYLSSQFMYVFLCLSLGDFRLSSLGMPQVPITSLDSAQLQNIIQSRDHVATPSLRESPSNVLWHSSCVFTLMIVSSDTVYGWITQRDVQHSAVNAVA